MNAPRSSLLMVDTSTRNSANGETDDVPSAASPRMRAPASFYHPRVFGNPAHRKKSAEHDFTGANRITTLPGWQNANYASSPGEPCAGTRISFPTASFDSSLGFKSFTSLTHASNALNRDTPTRCLTPIRTERCYA